MASAGLPLDACRNQQELTAAISRLWSGETVAVMALSDQNDLKATLNHRELLADLPLIVVLPATDRETVRLGYQLRPRFINFQGNNFAEVTSVLEKLLTRFANDLPRAF
ncbi:MAG TPA: hypothetical protein ENN98_01495 [Desulfurivibrio alkaliphilus]|uniref:TIR domain-containing protein n=1 Tax=Desulfurivibrio alkaliphilus TaxID=427923 RepID=A0A7C2TJY0_9BACT|nr:hypothetical protein [Desulfurivibrio alkaliphilus]